MRLLGPCVKAAVCLRVAKRLGPRLDVYTDKRVQGDKPRVLLTPRHLLVRHTSERASNLVTSASRATCAVFVAVVTASMSNKRMIYYFTAVPARTPKLNKHFMTPLWQFPFRKYRVHFMRRVWMARNCPSNSDVQNAVPSLLPNISRCC